jgi:alpha-1,3-rhamnosyl/mannosyltransferase
VDLIFNAEALRPPVTGIGYYSLHLLQECLKRDDIGDVHCFTGTAWQDGLSQVASTVAHLGDGGGTPAGAGQAVVQGLRSVIGMVPGTKALYDRVMERRFEKYANGLPGNAVYHETNYILKPYRGPCVTTVHDLSHVRYPQFHHPHVVQRLDRLLPASLERADRVITVSDVVRREIIEHYGVPPERVQTIYEGVHPDYRPRSAQETATVLEQYGLRHKGYVLLVATLEPRKGIDVLLEAWEMLPLDLRRNFPLVMTGSSGWRNTQLLKRMQRLQEEGSVKHLGYVAAGKLPLLFSGAAVFSYPSVYEGFGLPVLDAMASGVPVVCRAGTSMAEFSDGSCLLCEGGSAEELATRLHGLLENPSEQERWGGLGLARSAAFSWERCAQETVEVYRQVS